MLLPSIRPSIKRLVVLGTLCANLPACSQGGESLPPKPVGSPATSTTQTVAVVDVSAPPPSAIVPASAKALDTAPPTTASPTVAKDLNVLVVTVDSMRADMPWLGYKRDIAPALTAFAKSAVSYSRFYSISSYTAMSLGGFLAGRYPGELDRSGYFFGHYPDSVLMFPELLQKAGIRTMSAHAHFYFQPEKAGFHQGFDIWEIVPGLVKDNHTDKNVTSPKHIEIAKKHLSDKANTSGRFFAWYHLLDPHDEYMPHEGIGPYGKSTRDKYDAEMTFTDKYIGELFAFVESQEWGKRTAIIVSADHGEAFGEHKMYRHGFEVWNVLTHVPLMIRAPGITPRQIDVPRSGIDLAPTIMELLGVQKNADMQGTSLVGEMYGKDPEPRDVIIDLPRTSDNDRRRAFVRGDFKLIAEGDDWGYRFFNVKDDWDEKNDLKKTHADEFEKMKAAYLERVKTIKDVCPKMREKLKGKRKSKPC